MKRVIWLTTLPLLVLGLALCSKPDTGGTSGEENSPVTTVPDGGKPGTGIPNPSGSIYPTENLTDLANDVVYKLPFNPSLDYDSVRDIDGNVYKTIRIGSQVWMAENLKTTTYNDSIRIPLISDNSTWVSLETGAYRWYKNDRHTYRNLYGALYNWYTVGTGRLCPDGWHVPDDEEWKLLEMELGMTREEADSWGETFGIEDRGTDQGTRMKAASGWLTWDGQEGSGTNSSGFTALPAGESGWSGSSNGITSTIYTTYGGAGVCTTWWYSKTPGGGRVVTASDPGVIRGVYPGMCGLSVRCIKD